MFVTTLQSNGYQVVKAKDRFGERTKDEKLLNFCAENDHVFITHDKKDFSGHVHDEIRHPGIIIYTDTNYLHSAPEDAVRTLEMIISLYPPDEFDNSAVWLDQWR